jgi:hypothetical protein
MDVHKNVSRRAGVSAGTKAKLETGWKAARTATHAGRMAVSYCNRALSAFCCRAFARRRQAAGRVSNLRYDPGMVRKSHFDPLRVREEIAIAAARMIAEDGLDYSTAKRKAARQVVGETRVGGEWLPDNGQIEEEIREYQAIFQSDSQPAVLRRMREVALVWMHRLEPFNPYLTGAVLNGTAGEHSDIHLQCFCDNPKEVAIYLLNANIQYDVSETRHFAGRGYVETLSFLMRPSRDEEPMGLHIALYDTNDLRGAVRADGRGKLARANPATVRALLDHPPVSANDGESE